MTPTRIPVNVVFGATGSGKTTLIRRLLTHRASQERWAVLTNDFGAATLTGAAGVSDRRVVVREVSGCICCSAHVALRTALVAVMRAEKPARLLIEASASAEPGAIFRVLREAGVAAAVDVRSTLAAADATQLVDPRYAANPTYRAQLAAAVLVVLSDGKGDANIHSAARAAAAGMVSAGTRIVDGADRLDPDMLDSNYRTG
jgi:G3E family GTPase